MPRFILPLLLLIWVLPGCDKSKQQESAEKKVASAPVLLISNEDLHIVRSNTLALGPSITGSVQPERRADLRAEVSAVVLQVLKENGDVVHTGDLLARLDDTAIRDSLTSAEAASRAAALNVEQAERQYQRMTTLRASGMTSAQLLEDAENRRNSTQSELVSAKARVVQARQQLQRTEVRAPFNGVVSDRRASAGDTAQIGKEILKVIDPASMRIEGLVSADSVGSVKVGQSVYFRVNGYGEEEFVGKIRRVNPSANATTRQVEVIVDFAAGKQPKLAGLYIEGRVETETTNNLTVPASALVRDGDKTSVWAVRGGVLQKVAIVIGMRDDRSGNFVLRGGLSEGDKLLRYPTTSLKDQQKVELTGAVKKTAQPGGTSATTTAAKGAETAQTAPAAPTVTRK